MYKTFIKQVASLQIILGLVMLVPAIFAIIYQEWYSLAGFLIAGTFTALLGYLVYRIFEKTEEPQQKHSLAIAAIGWLMIMVFGAIPYFIIAHITPLEVMQQFVPAGMNYTSSLLNFKNPLHCLFESTSAFTTTGLTMAYNEPSVGKSILFYRCFSQWVGGAGFIVMAIAVFKHLPGQGAIQLYGSEASGTKLRTNVIETARAIWKVYFVVTFSMFIYIAIGTYFILPNYPLSENIFDAINHAMTGQSTGGFSTLDDSIAGYQSAKMDMLFLLPMLLGGLSIPFFYRFLFQRKINELWKDIQTRAMIIASIIGGVVLSLFLMNADIVSNPFREGVFQFVSALTTTGWQTSNIGAWDDLSVLFIVAAAMIIGGSAGGTVGGIKIIRALLLQKGLRWHVNKIFLSKNTVKSVRFDNKIVLPEEMSLELARAGIFTLIYILFVFVSTLITIYFMSDDFTLADAIFESASAQGTVGLSSGITDPSMNPILEGVYILQMWAGRIEIIPILVLLRVLFYGTKPRII
ncbi:TrkH family potassium uptake protein [Mesonia aestuariivivens]|uniref:TrkH family potassium uptake protein n=1 Tax=Mesonia aestuariivivens TaxID=2796128 RepID=A0ABS6W013_9FLAO|nr:TrkH family potassium uptake protein [Mesonia aestuariivivens]MBW2961099.1 TrkH family potassium uptake protein [Mesonia aestuariivivens]